MPSTFSLVSSSYGYFYIILLIILSSICFLAKGVIFGGCARDYNLSWREPLTASTNLLVFLGKRGVSVTFCYVVLSRAT